MQPDEVAELTAALRREYDRAWAQITAELERLTNAWPSATPPERRQRLIQLQTLVRDLADAADELAARTVFTAVEGAYTLGAHATAAMLAGAAAFTAVDTNAITVFARDMYDDLLAATQGVRETTKTTIRHLARERVRDKLVTGTTATQAARDLAKDLRENGITSVVYKDGSRHGLREYTEVVTLTKTAEAYQVGGMNQMDAWGIDWCEIIDGPGCGLTAHNDPTPANGIVLPVSEARNYPLAHPRCRRTTVPRPDVTSRKEAMQAKASAPTTPEDLARAQEQARQNAAAAAARRRLTARTARHADGRLNLAADRTGSTAQRTGVAAQAAATGTSPAAARALARTQRRAV